jgi:hypothetical protein
MFTKAESAQPYIYSIFTPAGNCCSFINFLWTKAAESGVAIPES